MRHELWAFRKPVHEGRVEAVQLVFGVGHKDGLGRFSQAVLQPLDVTLDLLRLEHVAVDLGERRVANRDPAQQDHELQEIGVRLLPERFLRFAKQVVQQRRDGVRDGVRIEIVVERVVADAAPDADFDVVRIPPGLREDAAELPAKVAFHFQHQPADLAGRIAGAPAKELINVRVHARGGLAGADCPQDHQTRIQAALRNLQPTGLRRSPRPREGVRLAKHQTRRPPRLGFGIPRERPVPRGRYAAIHHDREHRGHERREEERRCEPERRVAVREHLEDHGLPELDQSQKGIVRRHGIGVQAPRADAGGDQHCDHPARVHDGPDHPRVLRLLDARALARSIP